jgi:hypothetical protein
MGAIDSLPIQSYMDECSKSLMKNILQKKEYLLLQRIKERVPGYECASAIDFIKESKRRFPRFTHVKESAISESWYFNDGSEEGLLLITFTEQVPVFEHRCTEYTATITFTYQ